MLVALKDTARTAASFARTIRAAMRSLGIPTKALAGHWCSLLTEQECLALCMAPPQLPETPIASSGGGKNATTPNAERARHEDNVRIVSLPFGAG